MHLFDEFFAAFIGILIAALPAPGPAATSTPVVASSTSAPSSMSTSDIGVIREALIRLQARFSGGGAEWTDGAGDRSSDDDAEADDQRSTVRRGSDDEEDADEDRGARSAGDASARLDDDDDERDWDDEDEDEDDDTDDDRGHRTTAGTTRTDTPPSSAPSSAQNTAAFTMAQVAAHATATSCYSVVGGAVYDLTRWIAQHPGGSDAIRRMCGVDASAAFDGQHGGAARPASELAGFKIGALTR